MPRARLGEPMWLGPTGKKFREHGTVGYAAGCRCKQCREAATARVRAARAARGTRGAPHGTANGYTNWRCRCDRCRAAWATYQREYQREYRRRS